MAAHHEVLLGFDFGLKRIGVAVGQSISQTANPLAILAAQNGIPDWNEIASLIDAWQVDALVVGIPYQVDNSEQAMTLAARKFAGRLRAHFQLPVYEADERFTSIDARSRVLSEHRSADKKPTTTKGRVVIDHYAAQLILEDWLRRR